MLIVPESNSVSICDYIASYCIKYCNIKKKSRVQSPILFKDFEVSIIQNDNKGSTFISHSKRDHRALTCWDTGCRVKQAMCWSICRRGNIQTVRTHVSAILTWGDTVTRVDFWLRGCPPLPLQIYDLEDLCPVGLQAAQTYLADRQPCRFPQSGFMFCGRQRCWG